MPYLEVLKTPSCLGQKFVERSFLLDVIHYQRRQNDMRNSLDIPRPVKCFKELLQSNMRLL